MVLERCTNAVATPFGVTGALAPINWEAHSKQQIRKEGIRAILLNLF